MSNVLFGLRWKATGQPGVGGGVGVGANMLFVSAAIVVSAERVELE